MKELAEAWYKHCMRLKPEKVVVKLYSADGNFLDSVNTPSNMWPLNGPYKVFHHDNCELIEDEHVKAIVDRAEYHIGHCYSNADTLTKALCDAGFDAKTYVGWLFFGRNQYPIHHAWTVLNESHVIDLADDFALQAYNRDMFATAKNEQEKRRLLVEFTKWAQKFPHTERCMPFGVPYQSLLYVGSECSRINGICIYKNLMATYPDHPCSERVQESGMTKMQEMLSKEGVM